MAPICKYCLFLSKRYPDGHRLLDLGNLCHRSPFLERTKAEKSPGITNTTKNSRDIPAVSDCRKTYITKRVVRPTPINPQKAATCAWLFALLKGQVCAKGVHTAPCKNSKKWPKPLFRHAQTAGTSRLFFYPKIPISKRDCLPYPSSICKNPRPVRGFLHLSRGQCGRMAARRPCKNSKKWPKATFSISSSREIFPSAFLFM